MCLCLSIYQKPFSKKEPQTLADHLVNPRNKYSSFTPLQGLHGEQLFKLLKQNSKPEQQQPTENTHNLCVYEIKSQQLK